MINMTPRESLAKLVDGSTLYYLSDSSSLQQLVAKAFEKKDDMLTKNDYSNYQLELENQLSSQTISSRSNKRSVFTGTATSSYIAQSESEIQEKNIEIREIIISQYENEMRMLIRQDEFIDGEVSNSERYMIEEYERGHLDFISDALMRIYSSSFGEAHMLEGILTMIASVPYEAILPNGQVMAMGLLTHKVLSVRDKAIQCFERWNSKKGLGYLRNISCSPEWLQNYVDKVVMYIERDGVE